MRFVNHGSDPIEVHFPDGWYPGATLVHPGYANAIVIAKDWDECDLAAELIATLCGQGLNVEEGGAAEAYGQHLPDRGAWIHQHAVSGALAELAEIRQQA